MYWITVSTESRNLDKNLKPKKKHVLMIEFGNGSRAHEEVHFYLTKLKQTILQHHTDNYLCTVGHVEDKPNI